MKLLVVEDDPTTRNILKLGLESKMFIVDLAEDGETGSFMARTNDYDLIILDNVLPIKSGGHICKEIRNSEIYTPIIILSARSEVLTKVELLNIGADDYITKPFSFEELVARINALARRPKKIISKILKINDYELDLDKQMMFKDNQEVYLTKKEYSLMEYLLINRGKILTRGQILEHVWDSHIDIFSNTVETHILNLRKKIKDYKRKIIETIPGRGYRISFH